MISQLNQALIRKACGEAATQRGRNYFAMGKVLKTEISRYTDNMVVHASVSGSAGRIYSQAIAIAGPEKKHLAIHGLCSCPMMLNCKHVAAALIHLLESETPDGRALINEKIDRWMDTLKQASRPSAQGQSAQGTDSNRYHLVYVLSIESHAGGPKLTLFSQKVRLLNRGGYGKPATYPLEKMNFSYNDGLIQPVDQEIARLLVNPKVYYYNNANSYRLEGEFGELALRKMLACKRCFWGSTDSPPLILGQARKIEFNWETAKDGQRLISRVDPPADRLVRLDSHWYIDPGISEIGVLYHEYFSGDQISALLAAPSIPADRLQDISRRLLIDLPEYRLEPPVKLEFEEVRIEGEQPTPRLCLKSREDPPLGLDTAGHFHVAHLRFGYGPVNLEDFASQEISRLVQGNTVYTIHRLVDSEIAAMNELNDRGLVLMGSEHTQSFPALEWLFPAETLADSVSLWHDFIESGLPQLRERGWDIEIDETFLLRFDEVDEWHAELDEQEGSEWFSLALGVEVDGQYINLLPVLVNLLSQSRDPRKLRESLEQEPHCWISLEAHHWLKIPSERLAPIFDTLVELYDREALDGRGNLSLSRHQGIQIGDLLNDPSIRWRGAEELKRLSERLRNFQGIEQVRPPAGFNTELRPYQLQGLSWMQFLRGFDFNGILADDMGLGKTVQALAHLLLEKQLGRMETPTLIIAPTSLMGNWRREAQRFAPDLKLLVLHGAERHDQFEAIGAHDVILTTYPLLRRDQEHLLKHRFHYIVLDEAQTVKNPKSQTTRLVYELKCSHKLCLTGTPMENHLGELWSMFHFLMPGFLGTLERFNRLFRNPVEKQGDRNRQLQLAKRIAPFLLRRTKQEVAAELPEKTEIIRSVALEGKQRDLYEVIRLAMDKKVREEIRKKGVARSHIMILDALLKLRQVCCDPRLVSLEQAQKVQQSAKMELLLDILPEMVEEGRKILLFSQFVKMLELIEPELKKRGIGYSKLTGSTRKRDEVIDAFQNGEVPVFLISLKAGGLGLNLTAADTVIHYDPWWNPAVENQATDRAHRIGQQNAVFVYKLVTEETVEEKILALQQKKQALADTVYSGKKGESAGLFSADDLTDLLKPLE
ncbi:MAG: SNF2-related protein [Methylococcales bacterium]